jgi:LysR family glycine cleavage system transcriptional activator/LysR family transcriptional regulator of beta-lactamase
MRSGPVLTVGVGPTLAMNWLIPRLISFYRSHPEVEVRMATGGAMRPVRDDWTCTIRRDVGAWPGYTAEEMFPSTLVPVCTPELAAGLRQPADLHKATLIIVPHLANDWPIWFAAAGLRAPLRSGAEVFFDNNAMAMQAVLAGVGIAAAQPLWQPAGWSRHSRSSPQKRMPGIWNIVPAAPTIRRSLPFATGCMAKRNGSARSKLTW